MIDELVEEYGEDVLLSRVTNAVFTDHEFDEAASTIEENVPIKAIISSPRREADQDEAGRALTGGLRATVKAATDILADREGRADQVTRNGILYRVVDVKDDTHPIAGIRKKTVRLDVLPGR